MYAYITWAGHGKADKELIEKIKQQLAISQIDGEHIEVDSFDAARQAAQAAIEKGTKTIVAIGHDNCFNAIIDGVARNNQDKSAVGYIPINRHPTSTTELLGIRSWKDSLSILPVRKLQDFTLLDTQNGYILSELHLTIEQKDEKSTPIECVFDGKLTLTTVCDELIITNLENQNQPHTKNISIEARAAGHYKSRTKESLINLPHLLQAKSDKNQVVFKLLANEVKINPKDNHFNEYGTDEDARSLEIGHKTTTIRAIVKKHRN